MQFNDTISFGPFNLSPSGRLLTKGSSPVELGARALDILIALTSHPNTVISKNRLLAMVWPDVTVEEGSLRFHIANLRKALDDGKEGARYIETLRGRGYCFVGLISRSLDRHTERPAVAVAPWTDTLPAPTTRIVGRTDDIRIVSTRLATARFVTIVGVGGVGKTTVAATIAKGLIENFAGSVLFVDLGMLSDPELVAATVASMLGLSVRSGDAAASLIAYLRDKRILLVLDTCEHLLEAVADLASRIYASSLQVHILATSREALLVDGEHVYRLDPLACPLDDNRLTAEAAQAFPAIQLFVERAVASGARLEVSDNDIRIMAGVCRKLDGVALAIELVARRVATYGLKQTAELLDQHLVLLWQGQRTAPARQRTLHATLDWSYSLLTDLERDVLRRLAVFVGHFTLDAALAVGTGSRISRQSVFGVIDSLIAKSMVTIQPIGATMCYRLLDTTRAYLLQADTDHAGLRDAATRHATYYWRWLDRCETQWSTRSSGTDRAVYFAGLNNARSALEWCFSNDGDIDVGVRLASAAAPALFATSLVSECHRWAERAISALDLKTRSGPEEMRLQAALGMSLAFTRGNSEEARIALNRSLTVADQREDADYQVLLLGILHMFHHRLADFKTALQYAFRGSAIAQKSTNPSSRMLAHSCLGVSLHHRGDLVGARAQLEAAILCPTAQSSDFAYLGFNARVIAGVVLARNLWLQGQPDQAVLRARQTIAEAVSSEDQVTLSIALIWGISLFLWTGDLAEAEEHLGWFVSRAKSYSLGPYLAIGRGFEGELAIRRGDPEGGVARLLESLNELHRARYELLTSAFNIAVAQGLSASGRPDAGLAIVDNAIWRIRESGGDVPYLPELLRVKGNILLSQSRSMKEDAEACFLRSLELSRCQGARSWELRTAVDFANLLAEQRQYDRAEQLLHPIFEEIAEGTDTEDFQAAARMLARLDALRRRDELIPRLYAAALLMAP